MNTTTNSDNANIQSLFGDCEQTLAQMKGELKIIREQYQMWKSTLGCVDTHLSHLQNGLSTKKTRVENSSPLEFASHIRPIT